MQHVICKFKTLAWHAEFVFPGYFVILNDNCFYKNSPKDSVLFYIFFLLYPGIKRLLLF